MRFVQLELGITRFGTAARQFRPVTGLAAVPKLIRARTGR